jgi:hypothetical protein
MAGVVGRGRRGNQHNAIQHKQGRANASFGGDDFGGCRGVFDPLSFFDTFLGCVERFDKSGYRKKSRQFRTHRITQCEKEINNDRKH